MTFYTYMMDKYNPQPRSVEEDLKVCGRRYYAKDLAFDMETDNKLTGFWNKVSEYPHEQQHDMILTHMCMNGAPEDVVRVFEKCWKEYTEIQTA